MRAIEFKEATTKLLAPEGLEDQVYDLHIWKDSELDLVISKWRMSWRGRLSCLFRGHVWLHVMSHQHPPVAIETSYPFKRDSILKGRSIRWITVFGALIVSALVYTLGVGL